MTTYLLNAAGDKYPNKYARKPRRFFLSPWFVIPMISIVALYLTLQKFLRFYLEVIPIEGIHLWVLIPAFLFLVHLVPFLKICQQNQMLLQILAFLLILMLYALCITLTYDYKTGIFSFLTYGVWLGVLLWLTLAPFRYGKPVGINRGYYSCQCPCGRSDLRNINRLSFNEIKYHRRSISSLRSGHKRICDGYSDGVWCSVVFSSVLYTKERSKVFWGRDGGISRISNNFCGQSRATHIFDHFVHGGYAITAQNRGFSPACHGWRSGGCNFNRQCDNSFKHD